MPARPSLVVSVLALLVLSMLAFGGVALDGPLVSPDAGTDCRLIRGADTVDDETDDVEVCRQDVWFHATDTKAGNLGGATGFPAWDTTPPDTSVTGGAGGGSFATSALHQTGSPHDENVAMVAEGGFTGVIDTLAVELYLFPPAGMAQSETTFRVDAQLTVDGQAVANIADLTVPMETAGDAVQRIRFAWTKLAGIIELWGLELDGDHDVRISVHGTGIATNGALFVYDTTEVPAGLVFNIDPADLEGITTVPAS